MEPDLTDDIDVRLREARPSAADVEPDAFDAALLARLVGAPRPTRRLRPPRRLALPAAGLATVAIAAAVVLAGGPAATHAPRADIAAAAVRRAAAWFAMPPGKILHYRSVSTSRGISWTQEFWQSTDHPNRVRYYSITGGVAVDQAQGDLYDPARNTIYEYVTPPRGVLAARVRHAINTKIRAAIADKADPKMIRQLRRIRDRFVRRAESGTLAKGGPGRQQLGDWSVDQVHRALVAGRATVGPVARHDGVNARPVTITAGAGHHASRTILWTAAGDGRPLELVDSYGLATRPVQTIRYAVYQLLPDTNADRLLTLSGAHPGAHVVRSWRAYAAAERRLFPNG